MACLPTWPSFSWKVLEQLNQSSQSLSGPSLQHSHSIGWWQWQHPAFAHFSSLSTSGSPSISSQMWEGDISSPQLSQGILLQLSLIGETVKEDAIEVSLTCSMGGSLCDFPMWIFKPDSVLKWLSHWSHWKAALWQVGSLSVAIFSCSPAGLYFFLKKSSLRFAFLRRVDGLAFFLVAKVSLHQCVTRGQKGQPRREREMLNYFL